jgi:hypothetical protein
MHTIFIRIKATIIDNGEGSHLLLAGESSKNIERHDTGLRSHPEACPERVSWVVSGFLSSRDSEPSSE